jgi:hypothetical protein
MDRDDRHHPHHKQPKIVAKGELLVTGADSVVIEEELRRSRALLVHSEEVVMVRFKEDEPPCPPCNSQEPDDLDWEVFERRHGRELFLRIKWRVLCARTVIWEIYEVE